MLILYRIVLIVLLVVIVMSFAQGAKAKGKNAFVWSCVGLGLFILCGIIASVPIYYFGKGAGSSMSLISPLVMLGIPILITTLFRKKIFPGTPLVSLPRTMPITLILVITIGITLFLIANELNNSLLTDVVRSVTGSQGGLVGMAQVADAKGALIIAAVVGWLLIIVHFILSKRKK